VTLWFLKDLNNQKSEFKQNPKPLKLDIQQTPRTRNPSFWDNDARVADCLRSIFNQGYNRRMPRLSVQTTPVTVRYGGMNLIELLEALNAQHIQLNASATALFEHPDFVTSALQSQLEVVQVSVANLGFTSGATTPDIYVQAKLHGLALCPTEFAAYYRLGYLEQPEGSIGFATTQHCAPPGSVTIASAAISPDDTVPKGFYLRRIEGALWLRGYHCDAEHIWNPQDVFAFGTTPDFK
jgi:hypothetical protein